MTRGQTGSLFLRLCGTFIRYSHPAFTGAFSDPFVLSLMRGISLSGYVQLVDSSSRLIRPSKLNLSTAVPDILTRLNIDADDWKETLQRLLGPNKKIGSYFGGTDRLSEVAKQRGCKFIKNIAGRDLPLNSPSAG